MNEEHELGVQPTEPETPEAAAERRRPIEQMFSKFEEVDHNTLKEAITTFELIVSKCEKDNAETEAMVDNLPNFVYSRHTAWREKSERNKMLIGFKNYLESTKRILAERTVWDALTPEEQFQQKYLFIEIDQLCKTLHDFERLGRKPLNYVGYLEMLKKASEKLIRPTLLTHHYNARCISGGKWSFFKEGWVVPE